MTLVDIETIISWLYDNIERYDLHDETEDYPLRNWLDFKKDLRALAEKKNDA